MSIVVEIDGKAKNIVKGSLQVDWAFTSDPGSASFDVDTDVEDLLGSRVTIRDEGEKIWSGTLTSKEEVWDGRTQVFRCEAADNYYDFDRKKVPKSWNDTTAKDIIEDVVDNFTVNFTTNNVEGSTINIKTFRSNYEEPSRILSKLAKELAWEWFIDENRDVHFFPPEEKEVEETLTDENGKYYFRSLKLNQDLTDLKNRVFIRGGELRESIAEADVVDKYKADGETKSFPLYYKYTNLVVKVNDVEQSVGVDGIDDQKLEDGDVDCLYRFNPSAVRFKNDLASGDVLKAYGEAHIPLISQKQDLDSLLSYGKREHMEIRRDIESREEADLLADAILERYRAGIKDGSFRTRDRSFRPGKKIKIQSSLRNINDTFLVKKVSARDKITDELGDRRFEFEVTFENAGKVEYMDIMEKLLENERRNVEVSKDEKVLRLITESDSFSVGGESISTIKTLGPYVYAERINKFLYQTGDEKTNTTGGWEKGYSKGTPTLNRKDGYLEIVNGVDDVLVVETNNTIDLTDRNTLFIDWESTGTDTESVFSVATASGLAPLDVDNGVDEYIIESGSFSRKTNELDVSGLSGNYYVRASLANDEGTLKIFQVYTDELVTPELGDLDKYENTVAIYGFSTYE